MFVDVPHGRCGVTRPVLCLCLSLQLGGGTTASPGPSDISDPEVAKGVKQVEDGEYDTAILTLDAAAQRLAGQPERSRELAQAYLYLGIAFLGKGHETSARAQFREALARVKDLKLSPEKFAPRVIEIFEKARDEMGKGIAGAERKGGTNKGLIFLGVGGAAAAGIAVAASGGGEKPAAPRTETFTGVLSLEERFREFPVAVTASGPLEASVAWTEASAALHLYVYDASQPRVPPYTNIANAPGTGTSPLRLSANLGPGNYRVGIYHRNPADGFPPPYSTGPATFRLSVTHP